MDLREKLRIDKEAVSHAMVFFIDGKFYAGYERRWRIRKVKKYIPFRFGRK